MRAMALAVLVLALPATAMAQTKKAQTKKIILTNQPGIRYEKNGEGFVPRQDEGGYDVENDVAGVEVKTWYGDTLVVKDAAPVAPDVAIEVLTKLIQEIPADELCGPYVASLYKYRGIAWGAKLRNELPADATKSNKSDAKTDNEKKAVRNEDPPVGNDVKDFSESLRLNPQQADVYTHRGLSFLQLSNSASGHDKETYYKYALADFARALRIDKSAWTYYSRGKGSVGYWDKQWTELKKTDLNDLNVKARNAKGGAKTADDAVAAAQQQLADDIAGFTLADLDFARAKAARDQANKDAFHAGQMYFKIAEAALKRAEGNLETAAGDRKAKRDKVLADYRKLANSADLDKDKKKADKKKTDADNALAKAQAPFEAAITDLRRAIADFNESQRLEPGAAETVTPLRNRAESKVNEAQKFLDSIKK